MVDESELEKKALITSDSGERALITGFTGQDGSYLAEFLLEKGYEVYGMHRRISANPFENVSHLMKKVHSVKGDVTDMGSLSRIIKEIKPAEIYNLAGQSFVQDSWDEAISTTNTNALGTLNILESIRTINKKIRFYQASTSEMFGTSTPPQNEKTPFHPRSPYAVSKVAAHYFTQNYRESFNLFACSGILFNHESPRRGKEFVTRKISHSVAKIKLNYQDFFEVGNLDAKRDWGYAKEYVEAMWLMLQQDKPQDYVIGTGQTHSVREFVEEAFNVVEMPITWEGKGLDEVGKYKDKIVVKVSSEFYRPAEVDYLLSDPSKAKRELGWEAKTTFKDIAAMMVKNDLNHLQKYGLSEYDKSRLDK
jgi:GDPmannose 4,6-dehydratase